MVHIILFHGSRIRSRVYLVCACISLWPRPRPLPLLLLLLPPSSSPPPLRTLVAAAAVLARFSLAVAQATRAATTTTTTAVCTNKRTQMMRFARTRCSSAHNAQRVRACVRAAQEQICSASNSNGFVSRRLCAILKFLHARASLCVCACEAVRFCALRVHRCAQIFDTAAQSFPDTLGEHNSRLVLTTMQRQMLYVFRQIIINTQSFLINDVWLYVISAANACSHAFCMTATFDRLIVQRKPCMRKVKCDII